MYAHLAAIEDAIPQQTFLEMFGGRVLEKDDKLKLDVSGGLVTLYPKGFIVDNPQSAIMFGGYLDLLLLSIWNRSENKLGLWSEVFKLVRTEYENRTNKEMDDSTWLGTQLRYRRAAFSAIKNALLSTRDNMATLAARELLRKDGLQDVTGTCVLTRDDIGPLSYLFDKNELRRMFGRATWLTVRPVWSSPGELTGLQVLGDGTLIGLKGQGTGGLIGDPRVHNSVDRIEIAEDPIRYPNSSTLVLDAPDAELAFGKATVVQWESSIDQLRRIHRTKFEDLTIHTSRGEETLLEAVWGDFTEAPRNKEAFLFQIAKDYKDEILNRLIDLDLQETYQNLKQAIPDQVMHQDERYKLLARNSSYYAESSDGNLKEITNFQVEVNNVVSFKESNDIFIEMRITSSVDPDGLDIAIPYDSCNSVEKLHKGIRDSWLVRTEDGNGVPNIKERGAAAKLFINWIQQQADTQPQVLGVSRLGWSDDRSRFSAPYFEVTERSGVKLSTRKMHPQHSAFKSFDATPQTLGPITNQIPLELADLISQIIAMICRFKTGYTVRPVGILNCPDSHKVLSSLFRALGQKVSINFNSNQRQGDELPGIGGYPIYGSGYTSAQLKSSKLPGFVLMDDGFFPVGSKCSEEEIGVAAALLPTLVSKVTEYLLLNGNHEYERIRSLVYDHELRMEGANIICKACGMLEWPVSQMPYINFETILRSIPYSETEDFFDYDFPNQLIRIHLDKVKAKFSTSDLLVELSSLMKIVDMKDTYVELDAPSAGTILSDFYQNQVNYNTTIEEDSKAASE